MPTDCATLFFVLLKFIYNLYVTIIIIIITCLYTLLFSQNQLIQNQCLYRFE
jgi:hypothetical protein